MSSHYYEESKIRPSGNYSYLAASFADSEQSGKALNTLQPAMLQHNLEVTVLRIVVKGVPHVVLLADTAHLPHIEEEAKHLLTQHGGQLTAIDADIVQQLITRRLERTKDASRLPGSNRYAYESHTPVVIDKPASTPVKHIKPFIIEYRERKTSSMFDQADDEASQILNLPTKEGKSLREVAEEVYGLCMRRAEKYMFTFSALAMHQAVFQLPARPVNNHTWVDVPTNTWIELETLLESEQGPIRAFYLTRAYPKAEIDQIVPFTKFPTTNSTLHKIFHYQEKEWTLAVIRDDTRVIHNYTYDTGLGAWTYQPTYKCPYNACARVPINIPGGGSTLLPCERCKQENWYYTNWLATALRIVKKEYATSMSAPDYPSETVEYETVEKVFVGKGKNKHRINSQVKRRLEFRIVKFDVSIPSTPKPEKSETEEGKRANWLTIHGQDARIYKKWHFTGLTRRYEGSHYQHLIDRCIKEGTFTEEGREYRLETKPDGSHVVVSTIIDHDRYIPMLKPELRKQAPIKKVIASKYEQSTGKE